MIEQQPATTAALTYAPPSNVVQRSVSGDVVLLDLEQGTYFTLAGTGADIWNYLCAGLTTAQIASALVDEYAVDSATVERDIADLVEELTTAGLLRAATSDR